ncbi:MAG: CoB--CoM heterodisulfide reductase iron-sulfur subunit A family protein [Desulfobacteraceae bacterium]|nr:CoB--CoM heterodisulfide reductase iron-sulfur subunit A family protein [Desulfobacteraceae bacterium]
MADTQGSNRTIVVAGGGMTGLSAAVEAAEAGFPVVLVEREPFLGGRVARMNRYFPKLCPPQCGLEINFRRIRTNPLIRVLTMAEIQSITGRAGDFSITVALSPRFVNENCTACGECATASKTEIPSTFDYGIGSTRAAYLPLPFAFPMRYVVSPAVLGTPEADAIKASCPCNAIDFTMRPETLEVKAGAVIWATGWRPFDTASIAYYGGGRFRNVITNVVMERLAAPGGPTGGRIVRPSDGKPVKKIAFVQCAGSRDENGLPYCSGVCCLASVKQATYLLEQDPEATVTIFFIDIRTLGRYEEFFASVRNDPRVSLIKAKAGEITQDPETGMVTVQAENQATGKISREPFDMVVLAAGMVPNTATDRIPAEVAYDDYGFVTESKTPGVIAAGCVRTPSDVASCVQDATAAVLKAVQACRNS